MIQKTIQTIASYLNATTVNCSDVNINVKGVSIDSRTVEMGALYIPIIGARVDGHVFIDSVIEKKASASLWQKDHLPYPDFPLILVEDTTCALQQLARAYMDSLSCTVIAVTGSNGKTSCKDMLYSVFSTVKKTQCTQGNRNNEIGLPLTILEFDEDIEVAILEMGMENFNEIDFLCHIARPDISIITMIGSAHMENLGSKQGIAKAKLEILANTKPGGLFIYNAENPEVEEAMKEMEWDTSIRLCSFGKNGQIQITSAVQHTRRGITFQCSELEQLVALNVWGDFQAMNALPVIFSAKYEHLNENDILYGLNHIQMTKMRTQRLVVGNAVIIDDTYKSNPESAKTAIDTLMSVPGNKHIAVLSDMLDLGPQAQELHREVGQYAIEKGVDHVYCVGELSKDTAEGAHPRSTWFSSRADLVRAVLPYVKEDCIIVIKGSRAMHMDQVVQDLQGDSEDE